MADTAGAHAPLDERDVRAVLEQPGRLALVAQPIVDLHRGVIVGYELLSRFSLGRPAPPDRVFAAAALAGLGPDLDAHVLRRALALAADRPPNCFLTINVEPADLQTEKVLNALDALPRLDGIVFELTEHRSIEDVAGVRGVLRRLRDRGAMSALDDAGAGHSGLKQILDLQPQFLKADRDLVTGIHADEAKRAVVQMLGELAGRLDAWLLAEGIETEDELRAIGQLGVPLGQGYFLAKPQPPWCQLSEPVIGALARRVPFPSRLTVSEFVEPCSVCQEPSPWPGEPWICIRVGEGGRPIGMRIRAEGEASTREHHELLRVKRGSSLSDVALRAATRIPTLRWDPLVCVDDNGRFEGIVPMQRVVCALAAAAQKPRVTIRPSMTAESELVRH